MKTTLGRHLWLGFASFLATLNFSASASVEEPRDFTAFDQHIQELMVRFSVPGATVAIVQQGDIVHMAAFGSANSTTGAPVDLETVFQVGSLSKPVAAWGVMKLVESGQLELDVPVSQYLTRWQIPPSGFDASEVTVRRLLSHTSGLSLGGYPGFEPEKPLPALEDSLSGDTNGSGAVYLQAPPGSQFQYSGGGYTLLQLLVEEVSGRSFAEYMQEEILKPLGMTRSSYEPSAQLLASVAQAHDFGLRTLPNRQFRAQAAASLHTTAPDFARFLQANLGGNPVLRNESVKLLHTAVDEAHGIVGLGFFVEQGGRLIGHTGMNIGWRANFMFAPETASGIIVMTNALSGGRLDRVRCYWDQHFGAGYLADTCSAQNRTDKLIRMVSWAFWLLTAMLVASVARALINNDSRMVAAVPNIRRAVVMALLLLVATSNLLFWFTSFGVWLISGIWMDRAVDYAPVGFGSLMMAISLLLLGLLARLSLERHDQS